MGVSENGGFPQQPFGFPTKNDHFGGVLGVPPFKETPGPYMYIYIICIYVYIYITTLEAENTAPWKRKMIFQTIGFSGSMLVFFWVHRMTNYPAILRDYMGL